MQYVHLGRSGLRVSRLCLGTMNFGPLTSEGDSFALMDRAREAGINFFDTANVYGWRRGEGVTEQIIGRWLAQGGRPEAIVLASQGDGAPLPRARLRAKPLQPERAYGRAGGAPRVPRARRRGDPVEPARGRPARRRAPEGDGGPPRERTAAEERREVPRAARDVRGPLPRARRVARRRRARLAARQPRRHRADHRAAHDGAVDREPPGARDHALRRAARAPRPHLARPRGRGAGGLRVVSRCRKGAGRSLA